MLLRKGARSATLIANLCCGDTLSSSKSSNVLRRATVLLQPSELPVAVTRQNGGYLPPGDEILHRAPVVGPGQDGLEQLRAVAVLAQLRPDLQGGDAPNVVVSVGDEHDCGAGAAVQVVEFVLVVVDEAGNVGRRLGGHWGSRVKPKSATIQATCASKFSMTSPIDIDVCPNPIPEMMGCASPLGDQFSAWK